MSWPWYLKPEILLHRDLVEGQMDLEFQANRKDRLDQEQDRQLADLQKRVRELEQQLLALETVLDRHGLFYEKSETWIEEEKLYEVLYTFETEEENDAEEKE